MIKFLDTALSDINFLKSEIINAHKKLHISFATDGLNIGLNLNNVLFTRVLYTHDYAISDAVDILQRFNDALYTYARFYNTHASHEIVNHVLHCAINDTEVRSIYASDNSNDNDDSDDIINAIISLMDNTSEDYWVGTPTELRNVLSKTDYKIPRSVSLVSLKINQSVNTLRELWIYTANGRSANRYVILSKSEITQQLINNLYGVPDIEQKLPSKISTVIKSDVVIKSSNVDNSNSDLVIELVNQILSSSTSSVDKIKLIKKIIS